MGPDGAERSSEKSPFSSALVSTQLSFDSTKTSGNILVEAFACSEGGAGCNPLTPYQAGRNVASVQTVGPCSLCRTMHEDTRWPCSEDVNVVVRKPGLVSPHQKCNTGVQDSVFGC